MEAGSASGFIALDCADKDDRVIDVSGASIDLTIGVAGGSAALHTDCSQLDDFICRAHESWHGAEGSSPKVLIKASTDDFDSLVSKGHAEFNDAVIEKLNFLDADNFGIFWDGRREFIDPTHGHSFVPNAHVGDHHALVVTAVDFGLKNADAPFGIKSSSGSPDKFLRFARVHAAADQNQAATGSAQSGSPLPSRSISSISSNSSLASSSPARPISFTRFLISADVSGSPLSSLSEISANLSSSLLMRLNRLTLRWISRLPHEGQTSSSGFETMPISRLNFWPQAKQSYS